MADKTAKRRVSVYLDGAQVKNSVKDIRREMRTLVNEQANMTKGSTEYILHARKIGQLEAILVDHKAYQKQITQEYRNMSGASESFEQKSSKSLKSISVGFGKLKGMLVGFLASFTVDKIVNEFAQLDEKYADVMKTTGQTREEVVAMNAEFKKMNTRTAIQQLNDIAEEAGRVGIAKEDVVDFVKAMDVANVALGDSFSGGASEIANTLGKLKFLFKETQSMGVEKAYLSIASAINELGANGVASELNIANFTTRIGSLPDSLKPSIAETLALGAAFEESGVEAEVASRAYGIFLQKASVNTSGFAKVMGVSVKEVEKLINTDPVSFFLKFAESMKGLSATDVSKNLNELKLSADGVNKIIGAAASNTSRFKELIDLSNDSFKEGTSVLDEFNIKNNTFSANLDKQKKVLLGYVADLGEKLAPLLLEGASAGNVLMKVLTSVLGVLIEHKGAVLTVLGAYVAYNVALKAQNAYQKVSMTLASANRLSIIANAGAKALETGNTIKATQAQMLYDATLKKSSVTTKSYTALTTLLASAKALLSGNVSKASAIYSNYFKVIKINPYVTILAAIPLVFKGISSLNNALRGNGDEVERLKNKINEAKNYTDQYNESIIKEQTSLVGLIKSIIGASEGERIRVDLLKELAKEYPDIINYIDSERVTNEHLLAVLRLVNAEYDKRFEVSAYKGLIDAESKEVEEAKKRQILISKILRLMNEGYSENSEIVKNHIKTLNEGNGWFENDIDTAAELRVEYDRLSSVVSGSISNIMEYKKEVSALETDIAKMSDLEAVTSLLNAKGDQLIQAREGLSQAMAKGSTEKFLESQRAVIRELEAEFDILFNKAESLKKNSPDDNKTPFPIGGGDDKSGGTDKTTAQRQRIADAMKALEVKHLTDMAEIKLQFHNKEIVSEEEYNQRLLEQQNVYDRERKAKLEDLLKSISDSSLRIDVDKQIAEIDTKALDRQIADRLKKEKDAAKQEQDLAKWNEEETKKIIEASFQYVTGMEDKALIDLMTRRAQNKITEEQYQKEILAIQIKYLEERLRIEGASVEDIAQLRKQVLDAQINALDDKTQERKSLIGDNFVTDFMSKMDQVDSALESGAISWEEGIFLRMKAAADAMQFFVNIAQNFAEAEASATERKYDKQIAAAEGNSKKQKKLEEKKQKELNAIRAKYADKQFAVTVAQTISTTALAAMEAYKAMAGIKIIGPALGAAAAAAAVAYGASQIAVAKEQRDAAKEGYYKGGYHIDEGFTGGTNPRQVRGVLSDGSPVHGGEFIANHATTSAFKPLFDVFDEAQKHNTVSTLSKAELAKALNIPFGYMQGGYNGTTTASPTIVKNNNDGVYERLIDVLDRLDGKVGEPFIGYVPYKGEGGIEEAKKLDEKMKRNISRS